MILQPLQCRGEYTDFKYVRKTYYDSVYNVYFTIVGLWMIPNTRSNIVLISFQLLRIQIIKTFFIEQFAITVGFR